ncbi:MAG: hypothetical protein WKF37_14280 [Bryobacteraceae bacterium]
MKKSNWVITLSMAAVFLSGVLVGGFSHKFYQVKTVNAAKAPSPSKHEDYRQKYLEELRTRLELDTTQLATANRILSETHERYTAMKKKYRPESEQIKQDHRQQLRAILNDKQRSEYELFVAERDRKRK